MNDPDDRRWCCVCRRRNGDLVLIETWPDLPGHPVWAHQLCMDDVGRASA